MAYKFESSLEGYQSNLALFHPLPTDTGVDQIQWIEYRPVSQLTTGSFIEFNVPPSSLEYIDLSKTRLHLKARILKNDGTVVTPADNVAFVNQPLSSLIRQADVSLGQVNITPTISTYYAQKAYIDTVLMNSEDAVESQLQCQGFYKDTAGYMDATEPTLGGNAGLARRYLWTKDGHSYDLEGPIWVDCMLKKRLILNGVQVNVKLFPSSNEFVLMSDTNDYKVEITDAVLKVCHVRVNSSIILAHDHALDKNNAIYPYMRSNIKSFSVAAGIQSFSQDDLFQGEVPTRIIVAITSSSAFNGTSNRNPFNFDHHNLSFLAVYIDGESRPTTPFTPNYKTNNYTPEYLSLFTGTGKYRTQAGNYINKEDYANGFAIFIVDVDSNHTKEFVSLSRRGHTRLSLRFADPLPEPVVILAYGQFYSNFQIDKARNIIIN